MTWYNSSDTETCCWSSIHVNFIKYHIYIFIYLTYKTAIFHHHPAPSAQKMMSKIGWPQKQMHHLWFNQCVWSSFYLRLGNTPYYAPCSEFHLLLLGILWLGVEQYSKVCSNLWIIWGIPNSPIVEHLHIFPWSPWFTLEIVIFPYSYGG
jgi:hypothetical protein